MTADRRRDPDEAANPLTRSLERAAAAELDRALASFTGEDFAGFYVHAGAALELEIKAALVRINALLILDARSNTWNRDARRLLAGTPLVPGEGLRTVGALDAAVRLEEIEPGLGTTLVGWSRLVFGARNDVVHAGLVHTDSHESHNRVAAAFFQAMIALRSGHVASHALNAELAAGPDSSDYEIFGGSAQLVEDVVANTTDAEKIAARRAVDEALRRFESLGADQREMLRAAAKVRITEAESVFTSTVRCLACESPAQVEGSLDVVAAPENYGEPEMVILIYDSLLCLVCGLRLSGRELLLLGRSNAEIHSTVSAADYYDATYDPSDFDPSDRDTSDYDPDAYR